MILHPKRTFQPSTLRRQRKHGFFARCGNMETDNLHPTLSSQGVKTCSGMNGKQSKKSAKRPKSSATKLSAPKMGGEAGTKKRDNDLHRLLFMPNGLPDGADLVYSAKGQKLLHGTKRGNGILCDHYNREVILLQRMSLFHEKSIIPELPFTLPELNSAKTEPNTRS